MAPVSQPFQILHATNKRAEAENANIKILLYSAVCLCKRKTVKLATKTDENAVFH